MEAYNIKLIGRKEIAAETMSFTFEKPAGFSFKPGQYGNFTLIDPKETDADGNTRIFSLSNPPSTNDLMIVTRMRDTAFKRNLKNLPFGSLVKFKAPGGSFTLHNNTAIPAVYLSGGIGVIPVRSIVMQTAKDKSSHHIFLFYSNYRPEDAAFLDELKSIEAENHHYKFIPTMTAMENSTQSWHGEVGFINQTMLRKYIPDLTTPIYYVSGPEVMVTAMRKMLNNAGVNDDNIRTEEFSGY